MRFHKPGAIAAALAMAGAAFGQADALPAQEAADPATATAQQTPSIRFNFKGATFDQVIDYFSRVTGLPVVREADVPQGTLDYLAPEEYTLA